MLELVELFKLWRKYCDDLKNTSMDKNKGLVDNQDGELILNESGTSVSVDETEQPLPRNAEGKIEPQEYEAEISSTDDQ